MNRYFSECCDADLIVEEGIEYFHGCDDDYELKIPFVFCSKCREVQLLPVKREHDMGSTLSRKII